MIWAILAAIGVPLWLCALAILGVLYRNRELRNRPGDVVVRVREAGSKRWTRAHAIWVSDVFIWRGSPAAWTERALQVISATARPATTTELTKLSQLGPDPFVATMTSAERETFDVATRAGNATALLGPFAREGRSSTQELAPEAERESAPSGRGNLGRLFT